MARIPDAGAPEETHPLLDAIADVSASDFDLVSFVRARESRLCREWLARSTEDDEPAGEEAAVFGALVDALEPNGGWWLDVTAETLVEAGVRADVVAHQLEALTELIVSRIAAEQGEDTAQAARAQLESAAQDLVAACGRRTAP